MGKIVPVSGALVGEPIQSARCARILRRFLHAVCPKMCRENPLVVVKSLHSADIQELGSASPRARCLQVCPTRTK
jgi:hypothetical protein